jgi:hypothetical protein
MPRAKVTLAYGRTTARQKPLEKICHPDKVRPAIPYTTRLAAVNIRLFRRFQTTDVR